MHHAKLFSYGFASLLTAAFAGGSLPAFHAQEQAKDTTVIQKPVRNPGADPFAPYQPPRVVIRKNGNLVSIPSIEQRIEQYRAQKQAAMSAHVHAPKPTTALLLGELQVIGVTRTPRGYAAIVEATPIKLSYVVYPGERFYDGQLVAIEDSRLVFRHETVYSDGKRDVSVETKSLRQQSTATTMMAGKAEPPSGSPSERSQTGNLPASKGPTHEAIESAIGKSTVLIGMEMPDVSRAWAESHDDQKLVEENGQVIHIWSYSRGEVYFRNGLVYKVVLLKS
jgi:hypothetical protein